jgi:hypothetical protein
MCGDKLLKFIPECKEEIYYRFVAVATPSVPRNVLVLRYVSQNKENECFEIN